MCVRLNVRVCMRLCDNECMSLLLSLDSGALDGLL